MSIPYELFSLDMSSRLLSKVPHVHPALCASVPYRSSSSSGVLFATYSTLAARGRRGKRLKAVSTATGNSDSGARLRQIVQWCGGEDFEGCIVFGGL